MGKYFKELLNPQFNEITPEEKTYFGSEWDIKPPTVQELSRVIRNMKNNRAPSEDLLTAELIKHGDSMLHRRIHRLIEEVWETEQMPQEWSTALICPIH
jgi:hypothetical protein